MLKKLAWGIPLFLILAIVIFYFTASSGSLSADAYHQIRQYEAQPLPPSDTLKVMTYNLGYLSGMTNNLAVPRSSDLFVDNLARSIQLLQSEQPHLIGFQEIDYDAKRSLRVQQLDELAHASGYPSAFQSVNWDKRYVPFPYWPPRYHFGKMLSGEAILAHGQLKMDQVITLPKPVNAPFYYNAFYLDRLIQVADWTIAGQQVKVMNLHLEAFDQETRLAHGKEVKRLYEQYADQGPVILMGDFNSIPAILEGEDAMDVIMSANNIASAIPDAVYQADPDKYFTFSSGSPEVMIDYILYNPSHITPIAARVVNEAGQISDHLPVTFQFTFKEPLP